MKTSEEILTDVYKWLKGSALEKAVKGSLYKDGDRPTDATTEDITIGLIASTTGQIQTAILNVIIFVPDLIRDNDAILNRTRVKALERTAMDFLSAKGVNDWRIELEEQKVGETPDFKHFHCIVNSLKYYYCSI